MPEVNGTTSVMLFGLLKVEKGYIVCFIEPMKDLYGLAPPPQKREG